MCPHDGDDSLHTGGSFVNAAVLVYTHRRIVLQCDGSKDFIMDGSQIPTVMAMTITADSLLSMPKCGYDGGYDVFVKGPSVVVKHACFSTFSER